MTPAASDLLAACRLSRARFAGRADLQRRAEQDPAALVELCQRVGVTPPVTPGERGPGENWGRAEAWRLGMGAARLAARAEPRPLAFPAAATLPAAIALGDAQRHLRELRAATRPAAPRPPLSILAEQVRRRTLAAVASAPLRRAEHEHHDVVVLVPAGQEGATSTTGQTWHQYSRRYGSARVATSRHEWHVSASSYPARVLDGCVYLSETVRVRAGRGTSLVVERLSPAVRGLAWRAE